MRVTQIGQGANSGDYPQVKICKKRLCELRGVTTLKRGQAVHC